MKEKKQQGIIIPQKLLDKKGEYYLGLDVGTNSIGYAVTDENYKLIKKSGKSLWGVRLFTEAETAATRRSFRTSRRRLKRRKQRLALLQEFFSEAISSIDPGFYQRMKDSFFYPDDKAIEQKYSLFNDKDFTDKEYYDLYPTIYHLRMELMNSKEKKDPRLVYLACHHIMKNRGHFLSNIEVGKAELTFDSCMENFLDLTEEAFGEALFDKENTDHLTQIRACLTDRMKGINEKKKIMNALLQTKEKEAKLWVSLLAGGKVKVSELFPKEAEDEAEEEGTDNSIQFSAETFDEMEAKLVGLGDSEIELIQAAHDLYDGAVLEQLLKKEDGGRYESISAARVGIYERHARELEALKALVKKIDASEGKGAKLYRRIFRKTEKGLNNYVAYSGHLDSNSSTPIQGRCNQEDFCKFLEKELNPYNGEEYAAEKAEILEKVKSRVYLDKITSKANGVIPHQIHMLELKKILENAETYLPFLKEDCDGASVATRIVDMFRFRIPYYIGPMDDRSKFAWIKRKSVQVAVRPWNFHEVVDEAKTAELFIRRMTNKCTQLMGEDVVPKNSLLYSEYMARNVINTLSISKVRLSKDLREYLYETLFLNGTSGKVTKKAVIAALKSKGVDVHRNSLEGMDTEVPNYMKPYQMIQRCCGDKLTREEKEELIKTATIFSEGSSMLGTWVRTEFGSRLDKKEIQQLSRLKFKGWGRLSKALLDGILSEKSGKTVIQTMRDEALNLSELLFKKEEGFLTKIQAHNAEFYALPNAVTEEDFEALNLSPSVEKATKQVLLLVCEVMEIMGSAPKYVFVEMAKGGGEKNKRTVSRKKKIEELYKNCKEETDLWEKLNALEEGRFNSKKLYLYAMQMGRCMYSGEPIDLADLFNPEMYDIDHIYPRSLTKDDSFNNLVLVKQSLNREKSDTFPLPESYQKNGRALWKRLLDYDFITAEKFGRLTRKDELQPEELMMFINRQLVETRQTTKVVTDVLERILEKCSEVKYVKAKLASSFRYEDGKGDKVAAQFYFPKIREINDFHHAKDAYLNIVVGNVYHAKFTEKFFLNYRTGDRSYNLVKLFNYTIKRKDKPVWIPGEDGTIATVKKMMRRNDVLISVETKRATGGFYNQQLLKKGNGQYPIKTSVEALRNIERYGGYNSVSISHFCLVKHVKGKKTILTIVGIPIYLQKTGFSEESVMEFLLQSGYNAPEILYDDIKPRSILEINGVRYRIMSKTDTKIHYSIPVQSKYTPQEENVLKEILGIAKDITEENETTTSDTKKEKNLNKEFILDNIDDIFGSLSNRLVSYPFNLYLTFLSQGEKMIEAQEAFTKLNISDKIRMIVSLIGLLTGKGNPADLSKLPGGSKNSAYSRISSNLKDGDSVKLISYSITGFFENILEIC